MRHFLFILTLTVFLANTLFVSAWANPCVDLQNTSVSIAMPDVPCHNESQSDTQDHCDGLCLCLHISMSQIFVEHYQNIAIVPAAKPVTWELSNIYMTSRHPIPPYHPPIV